MTTDRAPAPVAGLSSRGDWAGDRWWLPGTVVAVAVLGLVTTLTAAWYRYEAGDCGNPGATFACLGESLLAGAAAVLLGPVLLWWAYRRAGVRRALPSVLVGVAVAFCLLALVELVVQVGVLSGRERPYGEPSPVVVGGVLSLAALGGGLALVGPRRRLRAVAAAVALGALVGSVLLLQDPVRRVATRLELGRAEVPLLVPPGWQITYSSVRDSGDLSYDAVPDGWAGETYDGIDVDVTTPEAHLDPCPYGGGCVLDGDVRLERAEPGERLSSAWRAVDGVVVSVALDDDGPDVDLADLLRSLEPVTLEQAVARLHRG